MATQISLNDGAVASAGALAIQTNGTTQAVSISTGQVATLAQNPILTSGTANGVAYLNGSKVLTTGSALTFDGTNLSTGSGSFFANGTSSITGFRAQTTSNYAEIQSRPDISYSRILSSAYLLDLATLSNQPILFTINSTEQMRLTSTGLGIGTSSPAYKLDVSGYIRGLVNTASVGNASSMQLTQNGSGDAAISFLIGATTEWLAGVDNSDSDSFKINNITGGSDFNGTGITLTTSGNLLVGTTSSLPSFANGRIEVATAASSYGIVIDSTASSASGIGIRGNDSTTALSFFNAQSGATVGTVVINSSSTSYNTSSDYRLKNTITPMTGALAKVSALKPVTYKWNIDGSDGEGFIAHELAEVVPQCVTGEKDAVDEDGNPKYQGIDTSFLVATLTAAIQEQQAIIQSLTARITALESA